jgi:hypothetical protein
MTSFYLVNPGAFPEVVADVTLSTDVYDKACRLPEPDATVDWKISAVNDTGDVGITSVEALIHGPIGAGMLSSSRPPVTGQVPTVPPSGTRSRKCLHCAMKRSNLVPRIDQVMFQVELLLMADIIVP